jgi:hypothetical protein
VKPSNIQLAAFAKRHLRALRYTRREPLVKMVDWYAHVAGLGVMRVDGKLVAIAMARCVQSIAQALEEPWAHDEDAGKVIWVENIVSLHPAGIGVLLTQAMQRFGRRDAFAGRVFSRAGELRMLPFSVVERLTQNPTSHGLTTRC